MKKIILVCLMSILMVFGICLTACQKSHSHVLEKVEKKEATCQEEGHIEYWYCSGCDKYFSDETATEELDPGNLTIKKTAHKYQEVSRTEEPTCAKEGVAVEQCVYCGTTRNKQLPKTEHKLTHFTPKQATCEQPGNIDYYRCDNCGSCFRDDAAENPIAESAVVRSPLGHDLDEDNPEPSVPPTCGHEGIDLYHCRRTGCDYTEKREVEKLPHNPEHKSHVEAKESTCGETGNVAYWYCSDCEQAFEEEEMLTLIPDPTTPKKPHNESSLHEVEASEAESCAVPGLKKHWECSDCGGYLLEENGVLKDVEEDDVIIETIPCDPINIVAIARRNETCDTPGEKEHFMCNICHRLYNDQEGQDEIVDESVLVLPAGHNDNIITVDLKPATCTEPGMKAHWECNRCHLLFSDPQGNNTVEAETLRIEPTGHSFDPDSLVYDDTHHWHPATCGHTEERGDEEEHDMLYGECQNPKCGYKIPYTYGLQFEAITNGGDGVVAYAVSAFTLDNGVAVDSITQIVIPEKYNNVPVTTIRANVFAECTGLLSVVIPGNIVTIEENAFADCTALATVYYGGGDDAAFNVINLNTGNDKVNSAERIYYAEEEPDHVEGKDFWYYENNIPAVWSNLDDGHTIGLAYELYDFDRSYKVVGIGRAGSATELVIPSTYKGKPVTAIGSGAFQGNNNLRKVVIPDSVTEMGSSAFQNCRNISILIIGNGLTDLPDKAFNTFDPSPAGTLVLGANITSIGSAFKGNTMREHAINVYYAGNDPAKFAAIAGIEYFSAERGDKVYYFTADEPTQRGDWWHYDSETGEITVWPSLDWEVSADGTLTKYLGEKTDVEVPQAYKGTTIVKIGDSAFKDNTTIESVTLLGDVTEIGASAFEGATNLSRVEFTDHLTTIGNSAFKGCTALTSFNFRKVTSIGANAFEGTSLVVYNGTAVISIGDNAFNGLTSLTKVTISDTTTSIGASAFGGCVNIEYIVMTKSTEINIAADAFPSKPEASLFFYGELADWTASKASGNTNLAAMNRYIYSGNYPNKEGYWHYDGSNEPTVWEVMEQEPYTEDLTFTPYNDGYRVDMYNGTSTEIVIPSYYQGLKVIDIASRAFSGKSGIISVIIPDTVENVGSYAFQNCSNLTKLTCGAANIGMNAFAGCNRLTTIILTDNVKQIAYSAFDQSCRPTTIVLGKGLTSIDGFNFAGLLSTTKILFHGSHDEYLLCDAIKNHRYLGSREICFYEQNTPTDSVYKYWYYNSANEPTLW